MTYQDAIAILKQIEEQNYNIGNWERVNALNLAIEALKEVSKK